MVGKSAFLGRLCIALCLLATVDNLPAQTRKATAASYIELGDKFARQGDFDRAIGAYNIAIQFAPDFALAYFNRGLARQARRLRRIRLESVANTIGSDRVLCGILPDAALQSPRKLLDLQSCDAAFSYDLDI